MNTTHHTLMWFRHDLRLADNPALTHACRTGKVLPLYIIDETDRPMGEASRWWLDRSLAQLRRDLPALRVYRGDPLEIIPNLSVEAAATAVVWNRVYDPHAVARDTELKKALQSDGLEVRSFAGNYLKEPWQVQTGSAAPYKVFTPFWKSLSALPIDNPLPRPAAFETQYTNPPPSQPIFSPSWAQDWEQIWSPGEAGAEQALDRFLVDGLSGYGELRNRPDLPKVSRLSPHLHFGEISPRQIWSRVKFLVSQKPALERDGSKFLSELGWREFSTHLLYHFPQITRENWKSAFDHYPWRASPQDLRAWQTGQTGYPFVDAGMRQLWATGYMHNRVRMVVASFLIKHLQIHWKQGEAWFWDTLLDADLANNCASWQWVAGSGADAAPYFRIFNPITQGEKFDPTGAYVRQWCPELAALPDRYLNRPFEAPEEILQQAGIVLGVTYPKPIVDHQMARNRALAGYEGIKKPSPEGTNPV